MQEQTRDEPHILAAAERQMHAWALSAELQDRALRFDLQCKAAERAVRFVTISREAGAGGGEVGRRVGERLRWPVYDRNLLDLIAERFRLPRMMLDLVDETRTNWVYDVLGTWMDRKIVPHDRFVACLTRAVLAASRRGHAVFVGRAAQFILPRQHVFAVRLVASLKYRVAQVMELSHLSEAEVRHHIAEVDAGRHEFAQQFFHHDVADPHNYDLVINVERCGKAAAVNQILTAIGVSPQLVL